MTAPTAAAPTARFDATEGVVRTDVEIAAPPERVFQALTDPRQLAAWWGSFETYRTHDWAVDARPGGQWSTRTTDAAGREGTLHGEYRLVDPPRRLEYTWRASWDDVAGTTVRFDLEPAEVGGVSGTRVTVTHSGFGGATGGVTALAGAPHADGWIQRLTRLARLAGRPHPRALRVPPHALQPTWRRARRARPLVAC
ncbi:MAG TPA: SRPBCC domain-containing protein [Gemmatimonadaceae bacterium]|nr:SRPBCC domain-containing protein [Gemmatimonadaceae bacterium]